MKLKSTQIAALVLTIVPTVLLTSCVVDPSGGGLSYDPISNLPANTYQPAQHDFYRDGYNAGRRDAQANRRSNYRSHSSMYGPLTEGVFRNGYVAAYTNYSRYNINPGHPQGYGRLTASVGQGQIQVMQNGRVISTIRTASPNVESHHFNKGQSQIVVKSRGNHGPATVQLFDTKTGILRDKVLAFAIQNGQPAWARGMQD